MRSIEEVGDERRAGSLWGRIRHEPLVHFLLLGAAVFGLHSAVAAGDATPGSEGSRLITITPSFVEELRREHVRNTGSTPDTEEKRALIRQFAREEALYREARRLGLGRGDPIVRQRLVQKMRLVLEARADVPEPEDAELRNFLDAHPERFERPSRASFVHVFFDPDRRDGEEGARNAARRVRATLMRQTPPEDEPPERGDPFLRPRSITEWARPRIAATFGTDFADRVMNVPLDRWSEPVPSSHGIHLVYVSERQGRRVPSLSEIRSQVRRAWLAERQKEATERTVQRLVDRYRVVRPGADTEGGAK